MDHSKIETQQSKFQILSSCLVSESLDKATFLALLTATFSGSILVCSSPWQVTHDSDTSAFTISSLCGLSGSLTMEEDSTTPLLMYPPCLYSQITLPNSTCLGEPAPPPPVTLAAILLCCCLFGARKKSLGFFLSQEGCLAGWDFILRAFLPHSISDPASP